jgi:hypothetical protein
MVTTVLVDKRSAREDLTQARKQVLKSPPAPAKQTATGAASSAPLSDSERYHQIRLCAYFRAEQRGFAPGYMWDDWLAAEREVDAKETLRVSKARSDRKG